MKTILQLAAMAILAAACVSQTEDPTGHNRVQAPFDAVVLHRSACYGPCPVYTVEIRAGGQVTYSGEKYVKAEGTRRSSIPAPGVELLGAALSQVKFEQMRDKYISAADGCVDMPTDHPSLSIAVTMAGKTRIVEFYTGCQGPSVPARDLTWLADTIDIVARTQALKTTDSKP